MSKIDETNAVTQESLEPTQEQPTMNIKFEGFEDELTAGELEAKMKGEQQPEQAPAQEPVEEPVQEQQKEEPTPEPEQMVDEVVAEPVEEETKEEEVQEPQEPVEDIVLDDTENTTEQEPVEEEAPADSLPEWVQKLVDFHKETGGGLEEYKTYTQDFDALDDTQLLKEYYKATKPGYTADDINLLIDTKFGVEQVEEGEELSKEDRLKQLAFKDEVLAAKTFLTKNKEKFYADLKSGVQGAPEQYKEAVQFYDNHKKQVAAQQKVRDSFLSETKKVFNEEFQGFQFDSNGKKYRLKIGNKDAVMNNQLDINNVLGGFVDEKGNVTNAKEYHRAVWAAQNADKLFHAGIEAGKALALKERAQATKNPSYANEAPSKPASSGPNFKFLDFE